MLKQLLEQYTGCTLHDIHVFWSLIGIDYSYQRAQGVEAIFNYEKREPGSVGALARGFLEMLKDLFIRRQRIGILGRRTHDEISAAATTIKERLIKYHTCCTTDINLQKTTSEGVQISIPITPGRFRSAPVMYGFYLRDDGDRLSNGNFEGHQYLFKRENVRGPVIKSPLHLIKFYSIGQFDPNAQLHNIFCSEMTEAKVEEIVWHLCYRLIQDLNSTTDEDQRYEFIAEFIQDMMTLHPFKDVNNRTLVNLLLNEILIDIGFPPTVFLQPNVFDGFTPKDLVTKIKEAQKLLREICNGTVPLPKDITAFDLRLLAIALDTKHLEIVELATTNHPIPRSMAINLLTARSNFFAAIPIANKKFFCFAYVDFIDFLVCELPLTKQNQAADSINVILRLYRERHFATYLMIAVYIKCAFNNKDNLSLLRDSCEQYVCNTTCTYLPILLIKALESQNKHLIEATLAERMDAALCNDLYRAAKHCYSELNYKSDPNNPMAILLDGNFVLEMIRPYQVQGSTAVQETNSILGKLVALTDPERIDMVTVIVTAKMLLKINHANAEYFMLEACRKVQPQTLIASLRSSHVSFVEFYIDLKQKFHFIRRLLDIIILSTPNSKMTTPEIETFLGNLFLTSKPHLKEVLYKLLVDRTPSLTTPTLTAPTAKSATLEFRHQ